MRGKLAKKIRKKVYGDHSHRGTKYVQNKNSHTQGDYEVDTEKPSPVGGYFQRWVPSWGTVYATGNRRKYKDMKKLIRNLMKHRTDRKWLSKNVGRTIPGEVKLS